ncbi:MAG: DUF3387 domain-containing protein [Desulfosarcina sp.]|nr:DUF3387 domain-containing protein [Desulfosarcina sp.]MBC2744155.1 DUF3387 domain-containing protein [Desulfosarcina sp.]MBC2767064.1 DUF3387 domain-containing protein [Desulfosarcina sp.]
MILNNLNSLYGHKYQNFFPKSLNCLYPVTYPAKRILRKYGYPPDMQAKATELVIEQATVLVCQEWTIE